MLYLLLFILYCVAALCFHIILINICNGRRTERLNKFFKHSGLPNDADETPAALIWPLTLLYMTISWLCIKIVEDSFSD